MSRKRIIAAAAILLAASVIVGVVWMTGADRQRPNLLLITLDTTRADRLGCYGCQSALTPHLDRLRALGVQFEQAYCNVPLTLPSHATILTGLLPPEHGLRVNGAERMDENLPTLAETLRQNGYQTAAFIAAFALDSKFGLRRGFDVYDDNMSAAYEPQFGDAYSVYRPGDVVADAALAWLDAHASGPFFCWVHVYDAHMPYYIHAALAGTRFADRRSYDAEIAFIDIQVGRLMAFLQQRDLLERTLVVAVGDHGEGLGDHEESAHGYMLYDSTLHVPLIISRPGHVPQGARTSAMVSLVDLSATILDLLDVPAPGKQAHRGFKQAVLGHQGDRLPIYAETDLPYTDQGWSPLRCLLTRQWKYIRTARVELYDRQADPQEMDNLAGERPGVVAQLETALGDVEAQMIRQAGRPVDLAPDEISRLEALGYAAGARRGSTEALDIGSLPDVKDMVPLKRLNGQRRAMIYLGRFDDALDVCREMLRRYPDSAQVRGYLGDTLRLAGRFDEAQQAYRDALQLDPQSAEMHNDLAGMLIAAGRLDDARDHLTKALCIDPQLADAHFNMSRVLAAQGDFAQAADHYRQVLALVPDRLDALNALAWLLATHEGLSASHADEAIRLAQRACELTGYQQPAVLDTLAAAYAAAGRFEDAVAAAQQALALAGSQGPQDLADSIRQHLALYRADQPYREDAQPAAPP